MFDDPKKELRRLEEELWEVENGEEVEESEAFSMEDILAYGDEEDDLLQDVKALLREEDEPESPMPKRHGPRNDAVNFHRTVYADEEMDEDSAVFVEKPKKRKDKQDKIKKEKGYGCLPVILLLELAGIAGLAWWWLRWLS